MDLKTLKLPYWGQINFFIYWAWTWEVPGLLDLDSFYDKLYLESKETRAILLDFGLRLVNLINQAGMLLQKYEDFLELSVLE